MIWPHGSSGIAFFPPETNGLCKNLGNVQYGGVTERQVLCGPIYKSEYLYSCILCAGPKVAHCVDFGLIFFRLDLVLLLLQVLYHIFYDHMVSFFLSLLGQQSFWPSPHPLDAMASGWISGMIGIDHAC